MKKINNYIIRPIARGKNNIVWTSCLILFDFIRCRRGYNNNINVHSVFIRHWISTGRFVYTPLPPWENFQFDHLLRPPVSVYWNYCFFFHGIQHAAALKTRPRDVENIIRVAKARLYFGFYFFFVIIIFNIQISDHRGISASGKSRSIIIIVMDGIRLWQFLNPVVSKKQNRH